jgi:hypothetical protein
MALNNKGDFFDYDPLTGVTEYFRADEDGKWHMTYEQDVTHHLEIAKSLRNEGLPDEAWKKQGVSLYATIPLVVLGQMAKKGIKFFDQNHVGRVVNEINTNYPWLKTTNKHHEVR